MIHLNKNEFYKKKKHFIELFAFRIPVVDKIFKKLIFLWYAEAIMIITKKF